MQTEWAGRRIALGRLPLVIRTLVFLAVVSASVLLTGEAAESAEPTWAEKMFDARRHDFGVVAKGAKVTHRFKITNLYKETMRIRDVKTTCGCSVARPTQRVLTSGQVAYLEVTMDTVRIPDPKKTSRNAILTVVFDRPWYAEVRIPVTAFIRPDVLLAPGSADFGKVPQGESATRTIKVSYAGRADWAIKQIKINSPHIDARVEETRRARPPGEDHVVVGYDLVINLKPTLPAGVFRSQIVLVTDDEKTSRVPVLIEAVVESDFTISPFAAGVVPLGTLVAGQSRRISIVIKGRDAFVLKKIESASDRGMFRTTLPATAGRVQVLPLTVKAPLGVTELRESFTLTIEGRVEPVKFEVYGRVVPPAAP